MRLAANKSATADSKASCCCFGKRHAETEIEGAFGSCKRCLAAAIAAI